MVDELYNKYWESISRELTLLHNYLGVTPDIDLDRDVLYPYYDAILKYVNGKLTESIVAGNTELKELVNLVFDIFSDGADKICDYQVDELKTLIQLDYESYESNHLSFTWGHVMTSLCTILRMVYAYLFDKVDDDGCNCKCHFKKKCCRNTTSEYESWVSNVYPEDEEYDTANYGRVNSPWQSGLIKFNDCYRHDTETGLCSCGCHCHTNNTDE